MAIKEVSFIREEDKLILDLAKSKNLSVSGVKYSRGHDADAMECNIKIGNRIKATVWDDSWGGEYQYDGKKSQQDLEEVAVILNEIVKEAPKFKYRSIEMDWSWDMIIGVLVEDFDNKKSCKNKTIVKAVKGHYDPNSENGIPVVNTFSYKAPYVTKGVIDIQILKDFEKDGYNEIEILNKRYIA